MIPRIYLYAAAALVIGGLYWRYTYVVNQRDAAEILVTNLTASLKTERANRKIEQDDRRRADESAKSLETELAAIRNAPKPHSVFCRPASVSAASQGGTAPGADDAAAGGSPEEPLRDIGAAVDAVRIEQQTNAARQRALISWEENRTH